MKKLHLLILRSYLGPFLLTFTISLALLVMQFLWKYVDDLMGKGLNLGVIGELMFYATANLIPMALPLAVLLSSIMTFGNLAENNELTAMKSGGLSLLRIILPTGVFILLLSVGAYFFSNYTWPAANLKMRVLIQDITNKKPALAIQEGVIYDDIDGYSIQVAKKTDDGQRLEDVLIIEQKEGNGPQRREIHAEWASIMQTEDQKYLVFNLYNGTIDEEVQRGTIKGAQFPYQQTSFDRASMKLELVDFDLERTDISNYQESYEMLSREQLEIAIDSLESQFADINETRLDNTLNLLYINRDTLGKLEDVKAKAIPNMSINEQKRLHTIAISTVRNTKDILNNPSQIQMEQVLKEFIGFHWVAWHRKFTLSYACVLLFFIGAPLGAIIRKGGLGLPVVVSVLLFLTYYIISISGEKMAKTQVLDPIVGMWLSAFILTPVAIFLTVKAANESRLLDADWYKRIFALGRKRKR